MSRWKGLNNNVTAFDQFEKCFFPIFSVRRFYLDDLCPQVSQEFCAEVGLLIGQIQHL